YRHNYYKSANLDKLEQAKPELILCPPGLDASEKARLTGLAELFELPQEHVGWRARLHALAERLGEQAEAERWIETFERKVSRVRTSLGIEQRRPVVLTVRVLKNKFYAHCSKGMSDVLFEGIGAAFPIEDASVPFDRLMSLDELDAVQADLLLLLICQETETLDGWKELKQSPRWLSMRAVREDKVRLIPSEPWREYSPIALERMLEQSERLLSGKRP
ncbi:MAG: hypothetical protein K0Q59_4830, partial [Paenibacillus sp.]|nr:hypothetical protein [Paenibacillus sp.]